MMDPLFLDRNLIDKAIQEWLEMHAISWSSFDGTNTKRYTIEISPLQNLLFDVVYKADGLTVLLFSQGNFAVIGKDLYEYVKDKCLMYKGDNPSRSDICFTKKNPDVIKLMNNLSKEKDIKIRVQQQLPKQNKYIYRVEYKNWNYCIVTFNKDEIFIQGKPLNAFYIVKKALD